MHTCTCHTYTHAFDGQVNNSRLEKEICVCVCVCVYKCVRMFIQIIVCVGVDINLYFSMKSYGIYYLMTF